MNITLDVNYSNTFTFEDKDYLDYCEHYNIEPTRDGFRRYCEREIFDLLDEVFHDFDIHEVED